MTFGSLSNLTLGMFFHPPKIYLISEYVLNTGALKRVQWRSGDFVKVFISMPCGFIISQMIEINEVRI
jgi:hypothetical protein